MQHALRYESVLDAIGHTPLVRIKQSISEISAPVYAKVESFSPGLSIKDRIVKHMIEKAEAAGKLKPGNVVIEATSGNTGFSLAMVCAIKGYTCILCMKDSIAQGKIKMIEAMGARVELCDSKLPPEHPDSYLGRAETLAREIPGSFYLNQNHDVANAEAHYLYTGREIWEQTEGQITHFIASASTGGTISGIARYLKEQNPKVKVIGIDSAGSVLKPFKDTGKLVNVKGSTRLEGVGKKIVPANFQAQYIDEMITVDDEASARCAYRLARMEGLMMGYSSGAVMEGLKTIGQSLRPEDFVVILFSDHGAKYLDKIYDPDWISRQGFHFSEWLPEELPVTLSLDSGGL